MNDRFYQMLSLAMRAGAVVCGEAATEKNLRGGRAAVLLLATDASKNTEKKFCNMAQHNHVTVLRPGDRERIGRAVGRPFAVTAVVTEEGFAKQLCALAQSVEDRP